MCLKLCLDFAFYLEKFEVAWVQFLGTWKCLKIYSNFIAKLIFEDKFWKYTLKISGRMLAYWQVQSLIFLLPIQLHFWIMVSKYNICWNLVIFYIYIWAPYQNCCVWLAHSLLTTLARAQYKLICYVYLTAVLMGCSSLCTRWFKHHHFSKKKRKRKNEEAILIIHFFELCLQFLFSFSSFLFPCNLLLLLLKKGVMFSKTSLG